MSIRPLDPADVAPLAADLARLPLMVRYRRDAASLAADLSAALARNEGLLVEAEGGRVRGLAWFQRGGGFGLGAYLRLIAVVPGEEGKGAGAALLAAFEAEAGKEGRHAFLLVSDFNDGAIRFYERHGWTRAGALPGLVLPGVTELIYWKRLR